MHESSASHPPPPPPPLPHPRIVQFCTSAVSVSLVDCPDCPYHKRMTMPMQALAVHGSLEAMHANQAVNVFVAVGLWPALGRTLALKDLWGLSSPEQDSHIPVST